LALGWYRNWSDPALVHESENFQTTPFQKKSDFSQKFLGHLGHGFRNPIFPKNRIS
jgi:hypothetical protein